MATSEKTGVGARLSALAACLLLLLLAACGGDGHDHSGDAAAGDAHHDDSHAAMGTFSFGEPGDPSAADETVEVVASDPYEFDPSQLEVEPGQTVTFVVRNTGKQVHEFVIGDLAYQEAHEEEMSSGGMHHDANAVQVAPGEEQELTWKFPEEGEIFYGCHEPGHFDGGMVGMIQVAA
ncbi:MAG: plastocyanin/azurin family copper-binding protein [Actinomycetota bacterium]|nr:plastocyanin/azurin family copper-binding protein [Actinomycetota bacterium]